MKLPLFLLAAVCCYSLAADGPVAAPLKRTAEPPVILLNGYQLGCSPVPVPSSDTFGRLEAMLTGAGREVRFFDNCLLGRVPVESLGEALGVYLSALRYEDGGEVPQVDVIGHSMGGLIIRSYLAGKKLDGTYQPPFPRRIRKAVTIGTPHFGADLQGIGAPDLQAAQLVPGTRLLYDLAVWNQNGDDWRGVDAIAIAGRSRDRGTDGLVPTLNASGYFGLDADRTRVVPGCHTTGFIGLLLGCAATESGIASVNGEEHPAWQLVSRFLTSGDEAWRDWYSAAEDPELSTQSGLWLSYTGLDGALVTGPAALAYYGETAFAQLPDTGVLTLARVAQTEEAELSLRWNGQPALPFKTALGRGVRVIPFKDGVSIAGVSPASGIGYAGRAKLLPGEGQVLIAGANFGGHPEVTLDGAVLETEVTEGGLLATVPARSPGAADLLVRADGSGHKMRVVFGYIPAKLTEASFPARWETVPGSEGHVLSVGTEAGKGDLFESWFDASAAHEVPVSNLPEGDVYVRLWTLFEGEWYYRDYVIAAGNG